MNNDVFDVVVIGYGPVGQAMAALLGQRGYAVAVFERQTSLYQLSRAAHIDHESMRIVQAIVGADVGSRVASAPDSDDYLLYRSDGAIIHRIVGSSKSPSGWRAASGFYQPDLEDALDTVVQSLPSVEVHLGWEGYALTQPDEDDGYVEVTVREGRKNEQGTWTPTGISRTVRAHYVIGADGANSFVRQALGIPWEDLGFQQHRLVIDYLRDLGVDSELPAFGQIFDPTRPTTLGGLSGGWYRWEFLLLPGETPEEMGTDAKVRELISRWVNPQQGQVLRYSVYEVRSLLATEWRKGRAFLIGDAAHLMPPFLGQGLCSGLRDAKNLDWKLDSILGGRTDASLLDMYSAERMPHVRSLIQESMALGAMVSITDPQMIATLEQMLQSGAVPPPPGIPGLASGVLHCDAAGKPISPAGQLSVQGRVSYQGRTGLFDDVVGKGWILMSLSGDPRSVLNAAQQAFLERLGVRIVELVSAGETSEQAIVDIDGDYTNFFTQGGYAAVLARPDYYIYGGVPALHDLAPLIEGLRTQLLS